MVTRGQFLTSIEFLLGKETKEMERVNLGGLLKTAPAARNPYRIFISSKWILLSWLPFYNVAPSAFAWNTQCGNFRIFLSLRFYVKSILGILEVKNEKSVVWAELESLNFDFYAFLHLLKAEIYIIQCPKNGKNGRLRTYWFSKIDFT